ncbi:MAG: NAD(P)-dependent alcohol dehydrogenase [Verrucomicrobia bacterium]|nr:NAD(P)-dependent alcohol dehydrogenase [Verrucomicrobiota bacterium]
MNTTFKALAATAKGAKLQPFEFDPGPLRDEQVEMQVEFCGICHSDLSMLDNEWKQTRYPFVPGHEVAGKIVAVGDHVKGLKVGQRVGLGWYSESCMACPQCLSGNHNLCPTAEQTIVNRHGGFANRVRCHWAWAVPLPDALDSAKCGPLFCGGITVFNPILQCGVQPTDRVGVIGIGGLGHLALQFLSKWGCEVTAFTSSEAKRGEALKMGAHRVVNSRDEAQLQKIAGSLNFILCTANVALPWEAILGSLAPKGRLHIVGAVLEPIPVAAFSLIVGQKGISGSPLGSPATTAKMLEFCTRHGIAPITETFPMSRANEALDHLRAGQARYRIVLQNDLH